ncbi:MAG: HTH domain-containing protein, partial [Oscillospiraceae bacterium]|nr:HTH domain-containing protein [Oscillospiraceae bacterium]
MQINRLFEIVYMLMNKKAATAKELSDHFEVSQRTIYRDIDILNEAGIPVYTNKGKGGGISILDNFLLNKSVFSDQEQNEILFALQSFRAVKYVNADTVLTKLSAIFKKSK